MTTGKESVALVRSEARRRSQILGTQVISQGNAARLGVISDVLVDLEAKQVLVLRVREQALSGVPASIELRQVAALGRDAILIPSEAAFDNLDLEGLSKVVGSDVVSETGTRLGKVKDFEFNAASGVISSLTLSSLGISFLPGFILSTYQMSADEIVSVGSNRLIVADGAEARLTQLTKSFLEQFGIGKPPWEESNEVPALPSAVADNAAEEEDDYEQDYEDEYTEEEDDIYAEEEPVSRQPKPQRPPVSEPAPDWQEEYVAPEVRAEVSTPDPVAEERNEG
ncbi:MAG: PRC-barrel domain-containing protein [Cyanobacteriota bacterium]|nr:PRC-barrel domain-containing protein [Cyanobacteriota bacterium]